MSLDSEIENATRKVSTDSITMSVGEVANLYREDELNINPEFQRAFRWRIDKKSNLIESILLSIPLPSIFVFEDKLGKWELIDGLQRLSTIFEFMGILKHPDTKDILPPSILIEAKYLKGLNGVVWRKDERIEGVEPAEQKPLSPTQQRRIRTSRIQVEILRYTSDANTKFDLFRRLNRGGEIANAQEVRNCLCVMISGDRFSKLRTFSNSQECLQLFKLTDSAIEQQKSIEWLMRILAHVTRDYEQKYDVENFIDETISELLQSDKFLDELSKVKKAFDLMRLAHGEMALMPYLGANAQGNRVSLRQVEAIAVGIAFNVEKILSLGDGAVSFVRSKITDFWEQPEIGAMTAAGLSPSQRIPRTVPFGKNWFAPK